MGVKGGGAGALGGRCGRSGVAGLRGRGPRKHMSVDCCLLVLVFPFVASAGPRLGLSLCQSLSGHVHGIPAKSYTRTMGGICSFWW